MQYPSSCSPFFLYADLITEARRRSFFFLHMTNEAVILLECDRSLQTAWHPHVSSTCALSCLQQTVDDHQQGVMFILTMSNHCGNTTWAEKVSVLLVKLLCIYPPYCVNQSLSLPFSLWSHQHFWFKGSIAHFNTTQSVSALPVGPCVIWQFP